jgi:hypothetical protein
MAEKRNTDFFAGKPEARHHSGLLGVYGRIIFKTDLR